MKLADLVEPFELLTREIREFCINLLDEQGRILTWNRGGELITGYTLDEVRGKTLHFLYPPELVEVGFADREMETTRRTGHFQGEQWRLRKNGSRYWAQEVLTAIHDPEGKLLGFVKIVRDLSERREIEERLRQSEQRYREVIDGVVDYGIFLTSVDRMIISWNRGAELITGFSEREVVGQCADILFTPEDRARGGPEEEARTAAATGRAEDERWHLRKDGSRFWGSGILTARRDAAGNLLGFSKILRDQTARKH